MKREGYRKAFKPAIICALMLAVSFMLTGCGQGSAARYTYALDCLAYGEYEAALAEFQVLGEYEDSAKFVLYVSALMAMEQGEFDLAATNFENLNEFKSSEMYLRYVDARRLEWEEDYAAAQMAYGSLGSFQDSAQRLANCTVMIPQKAYEEADALLKQGEYQAAMDAFLALGTYSDSSKRAEACQQALLSQKYQAGQNLIKAKDYQGALEVFAALGSFRDSAMLADSCRQSLYQAADAKQKEGGFQKVQEAIALYESLDTYADAARRAKELKQRYEVNLRLRGYQEGWQYVSLGAYPQEAAGAKTPILWRVLKVENGTALLVSDKILDAAALDTGTANSGYQGSTLQSFLNGAFANEAFSADQKSALLPNGILGSVFLLTKEDIQNPAYGFTSDASRQSKATAYALAKSLHAATTGEGWWWLNTAGTTEGSQAIVYYNGVVYSPGLKFDDVQTGVRPAICVKLDSVFFEKGSGTAADPYRE